MSAQVEYMTFQIKETYFHNLTSLNPPLFSRFPTHQQTALTFFIVKLYKNIFEMLAKV